MLRKELEIGIKYCPSLEIDLPVYHHIEYKPRYSAKLNNIFKLDTNTDILKTQFSVHIEPDRIGREDVYQPGRGDGREAQVGRDDGHHGGQDVQRGGLGGGGGEDVGATDGRKERGRRIVGQYLRGDGQE